MTEVTDVSVPSAVAGRVAAVATTDVSLLSYAARQVASLLVAELQPVSAMLAEQHARLQGLEDPYRYIYFNQMNLAIKAAPAPKGRVGVSGRLGLAHAIKTIMNRTRSDFLEGHVREVRAPPPNSSVTPVTPVTIVTIVTPGDCYR